MGAKLTIEQMQALAKKRGGQCLSSVYINADAKLRWQCRKGHEWKARPRSVKRGLWCAECAGRIGHTIEQMQVLAKKRGGQCLSTKYVNDATDLRWQCKKGHKWKARPHEIKIAGHWCPECKNPEL